MKEIKLYKNNRKLILRLLLLSSIFLVLFFWVDAGTWHWIGMVGVLLGGAFIFILSFGKPLIIVNERGIKYDNIIEWQKVKDVVIANEENQTYLRLILKSLEEVDVSLHEIQINELHFQELIMDMLQAKNTSERRKLLDRFLKKRKESDIA